MPGFGDKVVNPQRYTWNSNEPTPEPLFFTEPEPKPPKKTKGDWLREREVRIWKKSSYWSPRITGKAKHTPLSYGKPANVPGAWRTENREDGW